MKTFAITRAAHALLLIAALTVGACANRGAVQEEPVLTPVAEEAAAPSDSALPMEEAPTNGPATAEGTSEVPLAVAETEKPHEAVDAGGVDEIVVGGQRGRHQIIRDLVAEAQTVLRDVKLEYVFTGKGKRETLRGRPVVFALWSDDKQEWLTVHIEIPRPPVKWRPGRRPLPVLVRTPGIKARHEKGTGAERLMFSFTRGNEDLKVYGRKFPVFDNALIKKKQWRAVAATATPLVYLPFTADTLDVQLVDGGKDFLLTTVRKGIEELRRAKVPSAAFPGELLADVVPPEVITALAVIEQTDDMDYLEKGTGAFEEVLNHYGLKRTEAYRYSVSTANAIGPMQFTNRRGNGTYALVVRRCPGARLDPNFERGATDLLNAMKAAICLFDIELGQMRADIRRAYWDNRAVLGIFPVAAYNGGPRNVTKLARVLDRMNVRLEDLRRAGEQPAGAPIACPCVWVAAGDGVRPVSIPKYNNENRGYIEKYQTLLGLFD